MIAPEEEKEKHPTKAVMDVEEEKIKDQHVAPNKGTDTDKGMSGFSLATETIIFTANQGWFQNMEIQDDQGNVQFVVKEITHGIQESVVLSNPTFGPVAFVRRNPKYSLLSDMYDIYTYQPNCDGQLSHGTDNVDKLPIYDFATVKQTVIGNTFWYESLSHETPVGGPNELIGNKTHRGIFHGIFSLFHRYNCDETTSRAAGRTTKENKGVSTTKEQQQQQQQQQQQCLEFRSFRNDNRGDIKQNQKNKTKNLLFLTLENHTQSHGGTTMLTIHPGMDILASLCIAYAVNNVEMQEKQQHPKQKSRDEATFVRYNKSSREVS